MNKKVFFSIACGCLFSMLMAQVPSDGLVGYWPFTGNANDESGNNYNGTVTGATLATDRHGTENGAYYFDGTSDYIYITNSSLVSGGYACISLWVHTDGTGGGYPIISGNQNDYNIFINEDSVGVWIVTSPTAGYQTKKGFLPPNQWNHIVLNYDGIHLAMYVNNVLSQSIPVTGPIATPQSDYLAFGQYFLNGSPSGTNSYKGLLDEVRIYNRALTVSEITSIYQENMCSDTVVNDTTNYFVSNIEFSEISPLVYHDSTTSLLTDIGGCDSIIHYYSQFVFDPTFCTDTTFLTIHDTITTEVFDTTYITETEYVSVTDTLIIDALLTGIDPPGNLNTLKVYPNPAKDHIFINTGDYTRMNGYRLKIISQTGATVFETDVEEALYEVNLSTWSGTGLYYLQLIDTGGDIIDIRKIVLQ